MITKVEQQAAFDKMMQGLNPAQKRAVDNMEGPVMVIAGPGTGKTQILGARIGKILLESDTRPENILCLTYTDAGVVAMRKRLLDFIGPDAYKVNLYTFHAFCNDIIQENHIFISSTITRESTSQVDLDTFSATTYTGAGSNATFNVDRVGSKYYVALNSAGADYVRLETITIAGTSLGGVSPANDLVITLTSIGATGNVIDFDFTGIGRKGAYVALSDDTSAALSYDSSTWSNATLPQQSDRFSSGLLDDGSSLYKSSAFVAVATGSSTAVLSEDLATFSTSALPGGLDTSTGVDVQYGYLGAGTNRFVVIGQNDTDIAYSDNAGSSWTITSSALPNTGFTSITNGMGLFVAVRTGSNQAAYSADGIAWTATTLPASLNWSKVVWGNGRFIAIANNSVNAAYSLDGINWTATTIATESSALPTDIAYGQGMFVVTSADTNSVCYSEYGLVWNNLTVTANVSGYKLAAFGNPDREPLFCTIADGTTTQVAVSKIGARARGRVNVASEKIFEVKLAEAGSGYGTTPPTITIGDPNNIDDVVFQNRLGNGALGNPSFANRGTGFSAASMEVDGPTSNGNADFLQNGNFVDGNAILVDEKRNHADWAKAMKKLIQNPTWAADLGERLYETVKDKYDLNIVTDHRAQLYKSLK